MPRLALFQHTFVAVRVYMYVIIVSYNNFIMVHRDAKLNFSMNRSLNMTTVIKSNACSYIRTFGNQHF